MDIKSRKSSKTAKILIAWAVLLPALLLVSLYPRMEEIMLKKRAEYEALATQDMVSYETAYEVGDTEELVIETEAQVDVSVSVQESAEMAVDSAVTMENEYGISSDFVNYAVEASYYLYGRMLQDDIKQAVDFEVLDTHGWINDYYTVVDETEYYAEYAGESGNLITESNSGWALTRFLEESFKGKITEGTDYYEYLRGNGAVGWLVIEFDEYSNISNIEFAGVSGVEYPDNLYKDAKRSVDQYRRNAAFYVDQEAYEAGQYVDVEGSTVGMVIPKNFKAVFVLTRDSSFVHNYTYNAGAWVGSSQYYSYYYSNPINLYLEMGALWIVIGLAVLVALVALILPFFKKLGTGWEKLFCMPFEVMCCIGVFGFLGAYLMFEMMCYSNFTEVQRNWTNVEILGYELNDQTLYGILLVVNFMGWAVLFLAEYTVVSSVRQFLCGPIKYLKNRLLGIMFIRWIYRQCKRFFHYMTDIDISDKMHSSIVKIVLLNGLLVAALCCGWFVGALGAIVYSIVVYVILRKRGKRIQEQYNSILHATEQMANGELKITLHEDLGIFAPLGRELEQVQIGFSKAVAEEAKSQNMKTELISNVSHDLKTPLTAIITYVNLLKQEGNTPEQQKNYIQTLDMKSQRLKVLIEDLFEVSKAQSGNIQLNFMDVDVVSLMKQLRLEMEDKIADSNLVFRWNLPEEKVILSLDGQKTYRIFENLLNNAMKYAMPQSRVYVDILNTETEVQIIFKNISAIELTPDAERLTERFVRGEASRTSEGSGLGLAIVKSFAELQGGEFKIDIDGDLFKAILIWKKPA